MNEFHKPVAAMSLQQYAFFAMRFLNPALYSRFHAVGEMNHDEAV